MSQRFKMMVWWSQINQSTKYSSTNTLVIWDFKFLFQNFIAEDKEFCPPHIRIFCKSMSYLQTIYLLYPLMETLLVYPQEKCQLFHIVHLNLQTIHNPTYHIPESTALWFQVFQLVYLPNLSVLHWHQWLHLILCLGICICHFLY